MQQNPFIAFGGILGVCWYVAARQFSAWLSVRRAIRRARAKQAEQARR
jgi:hypothetical protein